MRHLLMLFVTLCVSGLVSADPTGLWNTIDDKTKEVKSTVEVYIEEGKLYARIVSLLDPDEPNPLCDQCEDDLYNTPIVGLVIVDGLTLDGEVWQNGEILDPEKGDWYNCKIWQENDELKVKGNFMFISRTQTWVRPNR